MRTVCSMIAALALLGLTPSLASAQSITKVSMKHGYSMCTCHYGYGNVCLVSEACDTSGGRCTGSCTPPSDKTLTNR